MAALEGEGWGVRRRRQEGEGKVGGGKRVGERGEGLKREGRVLFRFTSWLVGVFDSKQRHDFNRVK